MNNTAPTSSNVIEFPSHPGMGKPSVINPSANSKRPRPIVRAVEAEELAWDPVATEQYVIVDDVNVRAGDSFAVVREGHERWPLGHVSDVYRPTSHRATEATVLEACVDTVEPFGKPLMSGHGYRVVHQFGVKHAEAQDLHGMPVTSRLTIVHDHTGLHALKARMVVYVGNDPLGSIVGARAIHVANNPEKWRLEVEAMVSKSVKAQDAILALLAAADLRVLSEADKALLTACKVNPPAGKWAGTLLDSVVQYFKGANSEMTWGIFERRLDDSAIVAMVKVLGTKTYGRTLDEALGGRRYSGKTATEWQAHDEAAAAKKKG